MLLSQYYSAFMSNYCMQSCQSAVQQAIDQFCFGVAFSAQEQLPVGYYRVCGNAFIMRYINRESYQCSFAHYWHSYVWSQACNIYSFFFELYRPPAMRGQLGLYPLL